MRSKFEDNFKCYSMVFFSSTKEEADFGGKGMILCGCNNSNSLSASSYSPSICAGKTM